MILGQLRIGARATTYAALVGNDHNDQWRMLCIILRMARYDIGERRKCSVQQGNLCTNFITDLKSKLAFVTIKFFEDSGGLVSVVAL